MWMFLFIILLDLALGILHLLGFLTCHYVMVLFSVRFDTSILFFRECP